MYKILTKKEVVRLRSPNSTRPWQHVFDPINGYLTLALKLNQDKSLSGESFNFGPDHLSDITVLKDKKTFPKMG